MERLNFGEEMNYISVEAAIHINRYLSAKNYIKGKRVLDVACGEGYGAKLLKLWGAQEVVGVDISEESISVAKKQFADEGIEFVQHSAEQLPFDNDSFDVVVSFETIEHVENADSFLQEITRVLKFGGIAVVSCPNDPYYYQEGTTHNPYHRRTYTWYEFAELTQRYLGDQVDWYMGFAVNGFMNVRSSMCNEPEVDKMAPPDMGGLFDFTQLNDAVVVPHDRFINKWNCNYYLGVWGANGVSSVASIFPRETFIEPDNASIISIKNWKLQFDQQKNDYEKELQKKYFEEADEMIKEKESLLEKKMNDILEENRVSLIEKERMSILLELSNKENICLWERISEYHESQQRISQQIKELEVFANDIVVIKNTKGYRLLQCCWKFMDKIKNILGIKTVGEGK